jgi:5'-deoxynucleotidase YfbR-like HD superfamily hydrolase
MENYEQQVMNAGRVLRHHTNSLPETEDLAQHSWGMGLLTHLLYQEAGMDVSRELLLACLAHDLGEAVTGDLPYAVKHRAPNTATELRKLENEWLKEHLVWTEITAEEVVALKFVDYLQLGYYCLRQQALGVRTEHLSVMTINVNSLLTQWMEKFETPSLQDAAINFKLRLMETIRELG